MDTTHQALVLAAVYGIFVSRFGDVASLAFVPREFIASILFTVLVSSTTQLFFTHRIWLFSGKKWIFPLVAVPTVVGQFVLQTFYMTALFGDNTLAGLKKENPFGITNVTLAAVIDVALAGCMIYLLRAERSDTSDQLVSRLMLFSLNSGLWTAMVALATVITLVTIPLPNLVYPGVYTVLSPLYCNTVLANLNSRNFLQQSTKNNQSTPHDMPLETFPRSGTARVPQKNILAIQVDTTKATDTYSFQQGDRKASDPSFV
jgi:hypothetical protein